MATRPRPVTRQEVLALAVTDADAFTALRYLRHRENVPSIPELEEKGAEALPGVEGCLLDLYHTLWSPEPQVSDEVPADRRYWWELLGQALKSGAYQELHADTALSELKSVLGTVAMGESVLALVPKEDRQKLREQATAQGEANQAEEQAQQAQTQAQMLQQLADAAAEATGQQGSGQSQGQQGGQPQGGQPSGQLSGGQGQLTSEQAQPSVASDEAMEGALSSGMTQEEARAIADQLAKEAADAKANADSAKQKADLAKAKAEKLAGDLLGEPGSQQAQEKLRELTRIGLQAVRNAQTKVEEVSETIEAWGLEESELTRQGIPQTLGILERMKRNEALKKFASLLGRVRKIASRKARSRIAGEGVRVATVETGRDLKRAQRTELVALVHPALRAKALQRWTRGELRLHGQKVRQKMGHGPVIVCEDGSGSMEGEKQQWAKAATLSLAHYAKLQKRSFGWILFDSVLKLSKVYPQGQMTGQQMLELAEAQAGGGTDFERPLRKAIEMIQEEGLKKADICLITDGECAVSSEFIRFLKTVKKELEINIFVILCDVGSSSIATVQEFADRIELVSKFTAETAEKQIFSHF
ncbi:hypothetical protein A2716_00870 [candidate division WWE3 bacterium RIFCSPHIGHO2_01_FULL_40_23]|uniref:VWFA domain-containing protein n=1 Tax=candidate division WWE3 bacterium RIFCSPLOWO2_01_FULL_41_18 TaxID=1802625 RepID=A0A1F4VFR8_UNCKA|nr:MAG: hypothetical protein A2716_00870 [candidate division WWE3 bacterium RIFCSPHIGHO2_01_FULL_40_23]OGC55543.1 MAG: hypothetical protein A3A78_01140 [candidate division WWE3 bacterium RIFCSPLOWO2_01_FULL_41_18]